MTTRAWTFPLSHWDDAAFREWVKEYSTKFAEVGLVRTADTGQINTNTVLRPTASTAAGYEIYRWPDSSLFIKLEYGTGSISFNCPTMWITVGSGSNGTGTITGITVNRLYAGNFFAGGFNDTGTVSNRVSVLNLLSFSPENGFLGFSGGIGFPGTANNQVAQFGFMIAKTLSGSFQPTNAGYVVYTKNGDQFQRPVVTSVNSSTAVIRTISDGSHGFVPHSLRQSMTLSSLGETFGPVVSPQAFVNWTALPKVYPVGQIMTVIPNELPLGSTFTAAVIGNVTRKYISIDNDWQGSASGNPGTFPWHKLAMLWE